MAMQAMILSMGAQVMTQLPVDKATISSMGARTLMK
jgi:hypothetical protein